MTREMRVKLWVFLVASVGVAAFIGWAISNGHPWLGIAAIVVFFIAPNFLTIALSVRRSRQHAEAARRSRSSKTT